MRFGLALPHYDFSLAGGEPISFESTARFAHMAERLEFDSAWVSDHFFLSLARYGGPPGLQGSLEALTTLAGLAATTERLRLAARHADGWNTVWRWTPEAYADRVRRAREACDEEGRDPRSLRLSLGMYTVVGEDHDDLVARFRMLQSWMPGGALDRETLESFMSDTLTGTPDQVLERVARFAELGVEEVIVAPAPIPFALPDPSIVEVFAETVMPKAREL